jgi:hypothetical protein
MFIDLQNLKNLKNILTRLVQFTCQNANVVINLIFIIDFIFL